MITQKRVLQGLAIVLILGSLFLMFSDVTYKDINCGSAVLPADLSEFSIDSGDAEKDNFTVEQYTSQCGQDITLQRFLVVISWLAIGLVVVGIRRLDRKVVISGDSIV